MSSPIRKQIPQNNKVYSHACLPFNCNPSSVEEQPLRVLRANIPKPPSNKILLFKSPKNTLSKSGVEDFFAKLMQATSPTLKHQLELRNCPSPRPRLHAARLPARRAAFVPSALSTSRSCVESSLLVIGRSSQDSCPICIRWLGVAEPLLRILDGNLDG